MNKKLEDRFGKLAMLLIFGYLAYEQTKLLITIIVHRVEVPLWQLRLTSLTFSTIFLFLVLYFTLTRLPPRDSAGGVVPRLAAVAGTFFMLLLIILPATEVSVELQVFSSVLIVVGTILSIYCIRQLGRSFSIMATARELVTEGPYNLIRHPLYGAEVVTITGLVLARLSPGAVLVGLVWLALQIRRAQYEEQILRESFPEYEAYARRVPMLLPGFMMPKFSRA